MKTNPVVGSSSGMGSEGEEEDEAEEESAKLEEREENAESSAELVESCELAELVLVEVELFAVVGPQAASESSEAAARMKRYLCLAIIRLLLYYSIMIWTKERRRKARN